MRPTSLIFAVVVAMIALAPLTDAQTRGKAKPKPKPQASVKATAAPTPSVKQASGPAAVANTAVKCEQNGLTDAERADLLAGHNRERETVKLPPLTWDCGLANTAQGWASRSIFGHSDTEYGENMFVALDAAVTVAPVLERWLGEKLNWNNSSAVCAAGKICSHYRQMVWRSTTKVGCGINRKAQGKWKLVLVCNYDAPSLLSGPAY